MHKLCSVCLAGDCARKEDRFPLLHSVDGCSLTLFWRAQQPMGKKVTDREQSYPYVYPMAREFSTAITTLGMFIELIFNSLCSLISVYLLSPHRNFNDIFGSMCISPWGSVSWFHFPALPCFLPHSSISLLSILEALSYHSSSLHPVTLQR